MYCVILFAFLLYVNFTKSVAFSSFMFFGIGIFIGNDLIHMSDTKEEIIKATNKGIVLPMLLVVCALL